MLTYDGRYLQAVNEILETYLLADDLYWPPGIQANPGEPPFPSITPGNILLSLRRVQASSSIESGGDGLSQVVNQFDRHRYLWRVAWEKKVVRDFHARLLLWRNFLEEYRQNPGKNFDRYPYEVTRRVQVKLLIDESTELPTHELELLAGLDRILQTIFISGEFVWEIELQKAFPIEDFWYLYGALLES